MIQVNLLPDIKAQYVNAQRTKRTVIGVAVIISIVAIGIVAILAGVAYGAQTLTLNSLQKDIDSNVSKIKSIEDLDKILTIQNQLNSVGSLHDAKPVTSRLFGYLQQIVPSKTKVDSLELDFAENTLSVEGNTESVEELNKFVDTLKFTEYKIQGSDESNRAFSSVVLSDFKTSSDEITYTIALKYEPVLFDSSKVVSLEVPNQVTTRSIVESPLFKKNNDVKIIEGAQ